MGEPPSHDRLASGDLAWPAEIDVFLVIGELALYVAYLDGWTTRHKLWPWITALVGLAVSIAGNIGHIPASTAHSVPLVDRLTAATSPVAAFAGLAIALLVLKQTRHHASRPTWRSPLAHPQPTRAPSTAASMVSMRAPARPMAAGHVVRAMARSTTGEATGGAGILGEARALRAEYEQRGARLSRRQLAKHLRAHGHTLSNDRIPEIAHAIDL